jgi:hypothetical protein
MSTKRVRILRRAELTERTTGNSIPKVNNKVIAEIMKRTIMLFSSPSARARSSST